MSETTSNLGLPYIMAAQAQKHVTHNEAIRMLDALVQIAVENRVSTAPPATPAEGDRYIVAATASGAWIGKDGQVAAWQDGAWAFFAPQPGWVAWVRSEAALCIFNGSSWTAAGITGSVNPTPLVGVNATADATNRLTVSSAASLFNHAGAGHQIKINKSAAASTASLLYQDAWSGRAEIGLTGDDDLHIKVSADGSAWTDAVVVSAATGGVRLGGTGGLFIKNATSVPTDNPAGGGILYIEGGALRYRGANGTMTMEPDRAREQPAFIADFTNATNAIQRDFVGLAISAGTIAVAAAGVATADHPGVVTMTSSATAASGWVWQSAQSSLLFGGGEVFECIWQTPAAFASRTYRIGFHSTTTSADAVDGAYFELSGAATVSAKTSANSVRTTNAAIYTLAVSTWYRFVITVNATATSVNFKILDAAGNVLATSDIATNIPVGAGRLFAAAFNATCSAAAATALGSIDFMQMYVAGRRLNR